MNPCLFRLKVDRHGFVSSFEEDNLDQSVVWREELIRYFEEK